MANGRQTHDGHSTHQLVLIQTQFLFALAEQHLDVEAALRYVTRASRDWLGDHWMRSPAPARGGHPRTDARSPPESGTSCALVSSPRAPTRCPCLLATGVARS